MAENITLDKMLFSIQKYWYDEALQMSTHNICFRGEIRKLFADTHSYLDLCKQRYLYEYKCWQLRKMKNTLKA